MFFSSCFSSCIKCLKYTSCCFTPCFARKSLGDQISQALCNKDGNDEDQGKTQMTEIMKVVTEEMQNMNKKTDHQSPIMTDIKKIGEEDMSKVMERRKIHKNQDTQTEIKDIPEK